MNAVTALIRIDCLLARYAGCDSTVVRVMSATDMDAVAVLADMARSRLAAGDAQEALP